MNTTNPITLKKHVTHAQSMELKLSGIEIVTVNFTMIANCKTEAEEIRVKALNETQTKKTIKDYYFPEQLEDKCHA